MQTQTNTIPENIKNLIKINAGCEDFKYLPGDYGKNDHGNWGYLIDWNKVSNTFVKLAEENVKIINERLKNRRQQPGIAVGDYLRLPDGSESRVTHHWGDEVQDGGGQGSFYMNKSGNASYSGSLDPGKPIDKIKDTGETKTALFWIFSRGHSGANRGFYFWADAKVWELTK